jgi:hypothetical protein
MALRPVPTYPILELWRTWVPRRDRVPLHPDLLAEVSTNPIRVLQMLKIAIDIVIDITRGQC